MSKRVDLFDSTYSNFETEVLERIRRMTFGEDFGQNSWTTSEEYRGWMDWLGLGRDSHLLEVASGSGGPAVFAAEVTGCRVTGIDINEHGVSTARETAARHGVEERLNFQKVNADAPLPFEREAFDALICVDSANHFPHRQEVLNEWFRVLKPGARAIFTDPVVVTGPVTSDELAARSSVGLFIFVPPGINEELIRKAGFDVAAVEDVTENAALVSGRWHDARAEYQDALIQIEGEERFFGLQKFFAMVRTLTGERRLSRIAYKMRKPVA